MEITKNKILFLSDLFVVIDISTETYPNKQTVIDTCNLGKISKYRLYANSKGKNRELTVKMSPNNQYLHRFFNGR